MMSARVPLSSSFFSSTTEMKLAGGSGGEAGAAPRSSTPPATSVANIVRTGLASGQPGPAAHRGPAVAELLGLHGLSLAAAVNRAEAEVRSDRVHLHEVAARVGHDPAVAVELSQLAVLDRVDLARRDAEVLAALGDR